MSVGLGADAARRLIARPIRLQSTPVEPFPRAVDRYEPQADAPAREPDSLLGSDLTNRLEAEIQVMKAVIAAERRENERLRLFADLEEEEALGDEARAVRDRWSRLVDRILASR